MGILKSKKPAAESAVASNNKRRSVQTDFANLKPLKPGGTIGFTGVRDEASSGVRNGKKKDDDDMESDDEDESKIDKLAEADGGDEFKDKMLSPEDVAKQGELADGVKKIKVCLPFLRSPDPY